VKVLYGGEVAGGGARRAGRMRFVGSLFMIIVPLYERAFGTPLG
jgi:hypothetical protein